MDKLKFRVLLCCYFSFGVLGGFYESIFPNEAFEKVQDYAFEFDTVFNLLPENVILVAIVILLVMILVSIVGLFFLKNWSRYLYLTTLILSLPMYMVSGITVYSPMSQILTDLSDLCAGAILLVCYLPSLNHLFEKQK